MPWTMSDGWVLQNQNAIFRTMKTMPLLGPNAEAIPGSSTDYYVVFDIPEAEDAREEWVARHSVLTLKIFDVTVATGDDAAAKKRAAFEFPVRIKTFRDNYETNNWSGTRRLINSTEIQK